MSAEMHLQQLWTAVSPLMKPVSDFSFSFIPPTAWPQKKENSVLNLIIHQVYFFFFLSFQSSESVTSSQRSGNLSALKKRWEQVGDQNQEKCAPVSLTKHSSIRRRPPVLSRPPIISEERPPVKSPAPPTDQTGPPSAGKARQPSIAEDPKQGGLDREEPMDRKIPEKSEEQAPTSPIASYEKANVPLNSLKMKFEKGENSKVNVLMQFKNVQIRLFRIHILRNYTFIAF